MTETRAVIIGAGFAGIGAAIRLRDAGIDDFVVLEKSNEVGGTWRDNTYPGCACDVPSSVYSYSFEPNPDWSHVYARQPEIQAYLTDTARRRGALERVRLNTEVLEARWSDADRRWEVQTTDGSYAASVLIAGAGPLHEPVVPDLPGLDSFKGEVFHSARWDHDLDLTGRRVAVVGTGSSAIQFVPEIQPIVEQLYLFQRTAPWVLPKVDYEISDVEKRSFRRYPLVQRALRGLLYGSFELVQLAQRRPRVMQQVQRLGLLYLNRTVGDPDLRRELTPQFTLGCKRILFSNTYYRALTQPNVELRATGVAAVGEHSITGADGAEREVDTIIFGTGFHATDPPIAERIRGRDQISLAQHWAGNPQAYLGSTIAGFPNAFTMIGPNLGNGHSSAIVLIEAQLGYIVDALRTMEREGVESIEVRQDTQQRYNAKVQDALEGTVWNAGGCSSYYLTKSGRNSSIYPWTTLDLRRRMRRFDAAAYTMR